MADKKTETPETEAPENPLLKPFRKDPEIHTCSFFERVTITGRSVAAMSAVTSSADRKIFLTHVAGDTFVVVIDPTRETNMPEYVPLANVKFFSLMRDKTQQQEAMARKSSEAKANAAAQRLAAKQAALAAQGRALVAAEEDVRATQSALEEQAAAEGGFAG